MAVIEELVVTNLGVIADVRLEPGPSLVVLTGETGAGKTLLLGALRLLLGGQASDTKVGPAGSEARVEGRFRGPDGVEIVAARRLVEGGRSRAYLDGAMVPAKVLDQNAGHLIEVVGQHDRLLLAQPAEVRSMLDRSLDRGGRTALSAYRETWATLQALRGEQQMAGGDPRALQRELDLVTYQVDEIQEAGFEAGDDDTLGATASRLRNSEELAEGLAIATHATAEEGGAADKLGEVVAELRRAAALDPSFQQIASQAEEVAAAVAELSGELRRTQHQLEREPAELDHIESRLALLSDLKRKYGASLADILDFWATTAARMAELQTILDRSETLDAEITAALASVAAAGAELRTARSQAAKRLADNACEHLRDLGFGFPIVEFNVAEAEPGAVGADRVELRFSSDPSLTPGPVARVASGGELSRLILALRIAGGAGDAPVVVFDEVDAGVGGSTALAIGRKMADLARDRQVLCVTHLPQVAAFADSHFVVERSGGRADVRKVEGTDRIEELSRMLAGLPNSEQGRSHAEELLALAAGS